MVSPSEYGSILHNRLYCAAKKKGTTTFQSITTPDNLVSCHLLVSSQVRRWNFVIRWQYPGAENAYYFTQRTDKVWLLTADIDNISFLNVYSYTSESFYQGDPIGQRTNLDPYTHREYTIYAGSQRMENDLMYVMIIHEDENASMALPSGIGSGEIFDRTLSNLNDVNRVYYLFMSPTGSSDSQDDLDNRAVAVGQYFIDNVIYG